MASNLEKAQKSVEKAVYWIGMELFEKKRKGKNIPEISRVYGELLRILEEMRFGEEK